MMNCHYCGAEIRENELHCPECGAPMDSVTQQLKSYREQTQSLPPAEAEKRSVKPVQHTREQVQRSQQILMITAVILAAAIVIILVLSVLF